MSCRPEFGRLAQPRHPRHYCGSFITRTASEWNCSSSWPASSHGWSSKSAACMVPTGPSQAHPARFRRGALSDEALAQQRLDWRRVEDGLAGIAAGGREVADLATGRWRSGNGIVAEDQSHAPLVSLLPGLCLGSFHCNTLAPAVVRAINFFGTDCGCRFSSCDLKPLRAIVSGAVRDS